MEKNIRVPRSVSQAFVCKYTQSVERPVISDYLRMIEPDAVQARRYQRFKRRTFLSVGPNEMWSLDQHDKFKRYGLFFHVGLDPYPGVIHWCKVWWTVRNPKLIAWFYLDAARAIGGMYYSKFQNSENAYPLSTKGSHLLLKVILAQKMSMLRMHRLPSATKLIHLWVGQYNIGGSGSMTILSLRFTGQCFERTGQLDSRPCLIGGLIRDYMTLEIPLNGMSVAFFLLSRHSNKFSVLSFTLSSFPLFSRRLMLGYISGTGPSGVPIERKHCPMGSPC
jgi:hypothetical protein